MSVLGEHDQDMTIAQKLRSTNWTLVVLIFATVGIGLAMLYSVADGNFDPWMSRQLVRFAIGLSLMFGVAYIDIRVWMRLAYPIYGVALLLLVIVEVMGSAGMGAQRWINIGAFNLQPSELMKIALVLALARYFHSRSYADIGRIRWLFVPTAMVLLPAALVLVEPDLGTASLLVMGGFVLFFLAGVRWWKFAITIAAIVATIPFAWGRLHSYQKARILTFRDPESDPLGAGYHILQSKIALGSGGGWGKGYLLGTQSHLNFLPEKHTDFIFTTLAEEFGLAGGLFLLALYLAIITYGFAIGLRARSQFARLLALGVTSTFFLYVFINVAMVMGLIPVVGVPLPLISYGGTAMVTILLGFGLLLSTYVYRDVQIPRRRVI